MTKPNFPQHDKLYAHKVEHAAVVGFLQWLEEIDILLIHRDGGRFNTDARKGQLVARYFDIDEDEFEAEKVRLLEIIRTGEMEGTDA